MTIEVESGIETILSHNMQMSQVCPKYRDITVSKFHKITNINGLTDGTGLAVY